MHLFACRAIFFKTSDHLRFEVFFCSARLTCLHKRARLSRNTEMTLAWWNRAKAAQLVGIVALVSLHRKFLLISNATFFDSR